MAECDHEESRLISEEDRKRMHLSFLKEEIYDKDHRTEVYVHEKSCFLLDEDLCRKTESTLNYTDYCERQNRYIQKYDQVFRFNITPDEKPAEVLLHFLNNDIEEMDLEDTSGVFAQAHVDNTPLEKSFESLFQEAYGNDAVKYLQKEYAVSLEGGRNAFIDYVIETVHGNYAIEENGVHYHHPQLIGNNRYNEQLIKQDTLCLYGFKVYRFSSENVKFHDQTIDQIKKFLGPKEDFIEPHFLTADRTVHLYEHQERMLKEMQEARKNGETTSLIVCPTGSGKSQIILSDLEDLNKHHQIHRVLIMVPTRKIKDDWMMRIQPLQSDLEIHVELYNAVFLQRNALPADYYDYIAFDAYGIIGLNSKGSANKGFLKLSPILFSPQMRLMIDLRRKHAQNEDLSAKRSAACNSGSTVSDVVPSRLLQRQSAEHTPDVDLHRSTVRYSKDVSLACAA